MLRLLGTEILLAKYMVNHFGEPIYKVSDIFGKHLAARTASVGTSV